MLEVSAVLLSLPPSCTVFKFAEIPGADMGYRGTENEEVTEIDNCCRFNQGLLIRLMPKMGHYPATAVDRESPRGRWRASLTASVAMTVVSLGRAHQSRHMVCSLVWISKQPTKRIVLLWSTGRQLRCKWVGCRTESR